MVTKILASQKTSLRRRILGYYYAHGRDLPWRKTRNPYAILVAEIMLQQTQVDRVIPKYASWLGAFPDFATLANSSRRQLLTLWSGLGYNSRALRLQELARIVNNEHDGRLPRDESQLRRLPGVGPYTARSVQIFAWNADVVCIDTNIRRILLHELRLPEETSAAVLECFAMQLLPVGKSRDWHNALMDYGAMVLTARKTGIRPTAVQSRFLHSRRWYRGQVIKLLTEQERVPIATLRQLFAGAIDLDGIIEGLVKEGLVKKRGRQLTL
jgi:A/G-specific adenine glycosylase